VVPSMLNVIFPMYAMSNAFFLDGFKNVCCKNVIGLESKALT